MANRLSWRGIIGLVACLILAFGFGAVIDNAFEGGWWAAAGQKDRDIRSVYERVNPPEARDGIFRLMELLSSESYRQADVDVQSSATATLKEFLLQFDPALDKAKQTGKTGYLGLLRARMRNDKDMVILYLRDLGLLQDGTSKGE